MKQFRISKTYLSEIVCDVKAESLEEAKQLAEKAEWKDDGSEHVLVLDKYKCCGLDENLDEVDNWEMVYDGR